MVNDGSDEHDARARRLAEEVRALARESAARVPLPDASTLETRGGELPPIPSTTEAAGSSQVLAYQPSMLLAGTEMGVLVKWALLLQEQMEVVRADRMRLTQECAGLRAENTSLKAALLEENSVRYAHLAPTSPSGSGISAATTEMGDTTDTLTPQDLSGAIAQQSARLTESGSTCSLTGPTAVRSAGGQYSSSSVGAGAWCASSDVLDEPDNLQALATFLNESDGTESGVQPQMGTPRVVESEIRHTKRSITTRAAPHSVPNEFLTEEGKKMQRTRSSQRGGKSAS